MCSCEMLCSFQASITQFKIKKNGLQFNNKDDRKQTNTDIFIIASPNLVIYDQEDQRDPSSDKRITDAKVIKKKQRKLE